MEGTGCGLGVGDRRLHQLVQPMLAVFGKRLAVFILMSDNLKM